jgi:hypothetical protein
MQPSDTSGGYPPMSGYPAVPGAVGNQQPGPAYPPHHPGQPWSTGAPPYYAPQQVTPAGVSPRAKSDMVLGAIFVLIGLAITVITLAVGTHFYIVAWGPVIFGAIRFFRGAARAVGGRP